MKISRVPPPGVADVHKATAFYEAALGTPLNRFSDGITFIYLPGTWVALYPFDKLAEDISPEVPDQRYCPGKWVSAFTPGFHPLKYCHIRVNLVKADTFIKLQ